DHVQAASPLALAGPARLPRLTSVRHASGGPGTGDGPGAAPVPARMSAGEGLFLHRVVPEDWASHRALRLDMLEADPGAFWADPHEARARDEETWREEIRGPRVHLQARRSGEVLGGIALLPEGYTPEQ